MQDVPHVGRGGAPRSRQTMKEQPYLTIDCHFERNKKSPPIAEREISPKGRNDKLFFLTTALFHFLSLNPCVGRGGASVPNRPLGEGCLSRASSLAILFGAEAEASRRACF